MGAAMYIPVVAFKGAFGLPEDFSMTWFIVLLGVVVTTYTMLGGMKAVIWTDLTQFDISIRVNIAHVFFEGLQIYLFLFLSAEHESKARAIVVIFSGDDLDLVEL